MLLIISSYHLRDGLELDEVLTLLLLLPDDLELLLTLLLLTGEDLVVTLAGEGAEDLLDVTLVLREEGLDADLFVTVPEDLPERPELFRVADLLLTGAVLRVTVLLLTDVGLVTELLLRMVADLFVAGDLRVTEGDAEFLPLTVEDDLRVVVPLLTVPGRVAELLLILLADLLVTPADFVSEDLVAVLLLTAVEVLRALPDVTLWALRLTP